MAESDRGRLVAPVERVRLSVATHAPSFTPMSSAERLGDLAHSHDHRCAHQPARRISSYNLQRFLRVGDNGDLDLLVASKQKARPHSLVGSSDAAVPDDH